MIQLYEVMENNIVTISVCEISCSIFCRTDEVLDDNIETEVYP